MEPGPPNVLLVKYVHVHDCEVLLFDLERDPEEWIDLSSEPAQAGRLREMREELLRGWDPELAYREVLTSQRRRRFLREALVRGRHTPWDYEPPADASRKWVRRDPAAPTRARWLE